LSETIKLK